MLPRTAEFWRDPQGHRELLARSAEGEGYYPALDQDRTVVGFAVFGAEARVRGQAVVDGMLDLGLGVRPDLTSRGGMALQICTVCYLGRTYSDAVFGLFRMLGYPFTPRFWDPHISGSGGPSCPTADRPLRAAGTDARNKVNLKKIKNQTCKMRIATLPQRREKRLAHRRRMNAQFSGLGSHGGGTYRLLAHPHPIPRPAKELVRSGAWSAPRRARRCAEEHASPPR